MPGETEKGPGQQKAEKTHQSGHTLDWWIEVIAKFATPLVLGILTVTASIKASAIQSKISTATLLSEREKAESQLRATMFDSLIGPIVGSEKTGNISVDRERLLVELVALNFHEHFEVKPLFERLDRKLQGMNMERESLRSVARRIVDRQIAMLQKEVGKAGSEGKGARVYSLIVTEPPQTEPQQKYLEMLRKGGSMVYQLDEIIPDLISPDKRYKFAMLVTSPIGEGGESASEDMWKGQRFAAEVYDNSSLVSRISASWADLPLTDNTLFPDGNRFAVVVYRVQDDTPLRNATLKFIWFPKDYFTPRERPLDHGEFLELVGKKT